MMAIALEAKSFGRSLRYIMATAVAVAVALAQYIFNYATKIDVSIRLRTEETTLNGSENENLITCSFPKVKYRKALKK